MNNWLFAILMTILIVLFVIISSSGIANLIQDYNMTNKVCQEHNGTIDRSYGKCYINDNEIYVGYNVEKINGEYVLTK